MLINPPIDRNREVHEVEDVYVHVVKERDDGMVVSGAKMLATGSALTHATFVAQNSAVRLEKGKAEDYALVFIAPMDTPGKALISRRSYELAAASPWDNPLSSRFDENDAVVVFDEAFIPWENVLVYRDVEKALGFYPASGFMNRYTLQAGTRLAVKFDFICGLIARALEANGTAEFRGVQAQLGELMGWGSLMWALTSALALDPQEGPGGMTIPRLEFAVLVRLFGAMAWPKVEEVVGQALGGSPIVVPSSRRDLGERRAPPADRSLLPRLDRLRPRPDQALQAALGRRRQRVRCSAHALRAELRRQSRAGPPRRPELRPAPRPPRRDERSRRAVPVRVRPRRMDGRRVDRVGRLSVDADRPDSQTLWRG